MFGFEKLNVWQESMEFTVSLYKITEKFPKTEIYSLIDQIRRSSSSISANVAEGCSRNSKKDQAHFTTIAYCSLMEVLNHLILAFKLSYIDENTLKELRKQIDSIAHKLISLRRYQQS